MIVWWKQADNRAYVRTEGDVRNGAYLNGTRVVICENQSRAVELHDGKWWLVSFTTYNPIELTQTDDLDLAIALINLMYDTE